MEKNKDNRSPRKYRLDAIRPDGLTFIECAGECIQHVDLVRNFDRLYGCNLLRRGTPFELAIDDACERHSHDCHEFLNFVWECVFTRLPLQPPGAFNSVMLGLEVLSSGTNVPSE